MLFDDPMRNSEPQARPLGLRRKKRRKQLTLDLRRNPYTLVSKFHHEHRPTTRSATDRLTRSSRRQGQRTSVGHGLPAIADEIQECLRQMIAVGPEIGETGIVLLPNLDAAHGAGRSFEGDDAIEDFVDVDPRPG